MEFDWLNLTDMIGEEITSTNTSLLEEIDFTLAPSEKFTDHEFPTTSYSLDDDETEKKKCNKLTKEWKRIRDISENAQLFVNGSEEGDVIQGGKKKTKKYFFTFFHFLSGICDCWFISAMAIVATKPYILVIFVFLSSKCLLILESHFYEPKCFRTFYY